MLIKNKKTPMARIEARVREDVKASLIAEASRRGLNHRGQGSITLLLSVLAHGFNPELAPDPWESEEDHF